MKAYINSLFLILLGELSPMQESKLVQLKSRVSDLLKGKVPSDPVFLRFLRARDFNVDKVSLLLEDIVFEKAPICEKNTFKRPRIKWITCFCRNENHYNNSYVK